MIKIKFDNNKLLKINKNTNLFETEYTIDVSRFNEKFNNAKSVNDLTFNQMIAYAIENNDQKLVTKLEKFFNIDYRDYYTIKNDDEYIDECAKYVETKNAQYITRRTTKQKFETTYDKNITFDTEFALDYKKSRKQINFEKRLARKQKRQNEIVLAKTINSDSYLNVESKTDELLLKFVTK